MVEMIYATEHKIKPDMQYQIENILTPIAAKHTPPDYLPGSDDIFLSLLRLHLSRLTHQCFV